MEIVLLGHMGRDEALADRLEGHRLHVVGQWENPGLANKAELTGGTVQIIDSISNTQAVADFVEARQPDMFITNFDDALAAGAVDVIRGRMKSGDIRGDLLLPCPDRQAAQVEWDKFELRRLVDRIDPSYNPANFMVTKPGEAEEAVHYFQEVHTEIVVKPRNPTGGKGVKVMGEHFNTHWHGLAYALSVLEDPRQNGLEIQEKLEGAEFTLQIVTDGKALISPPTTYDYPYREDGDTGPGTGGMGSFSMEDGLLPFVTKDDYEQALKLSKQLLHEMRQEGRDYKGVLYPTFFKTPNGLKIVEVNARGGDPEYINILDLLEDDVAVAQVLTNIAHGELQPTDVRFQAAASTMCYFVAPEYAYGKGPTYEFEIDPAVIVGHGCKLRFAAAEQVGARRYQTVGSSRTVGLSALGKTPWEARQKIDAAVRGGFDLEFPLASRKDVGNRAYINKLGGLLLSK